MKADRRQSLRAHLSATWPVLPPLHTSQVSTTAAPSICSSAWLSTWARPPGQRARTSPAQSAMQICGSRAAHDVQSCTSWGGAAEGLTRVYTNCGLRERTSGTIAGGRLRAHDCGTREKCPSGPCASTSAGTEKPVQLVTLTPGRAAASSSGHATACGARVKSPRAVGCRS